MIKTDSQANIFTVGKLIMKKLKTHTLEFSSPKKEAMLMKITKKKAMHLIKYGISQEDFEDLPAAIESKVIFYASTHEPGGYEADLYLDGEPVSGFQSHFEKMLDLNNDHCDPDSPIHPTKTNRVTYYIYWERFFKRVHSRSEFVDEFSLDKTSLFFSRAVKIGNNTLTGFEFMHDDSDLEEVTCDFGSDILYIINSNGEVMNFEIHD